MSGVFGSRRMQTRETGRSDVSPAPPFCIRHRLPRKGRFPWVPEDGTKIISGSNFFQKNISGLKLHGSTVNTKNNGESFGFKFGLEAAKAE